MAKSYDGLPGRRPCNLRQSTALEGALEGHRTVKSLLFHGLAQARARGCLLSASMRDGIGLFDLLLDGLDGAGFVGNDVGLRECGGEMRILASFL